jgi:hypothetical protein
MGCRAGYQPAVDCGAHIGHGEMERRPDDCGVEAGRAVDDGRAIESDLVVLRQCFAPGSEPDVQPFLAYTTKKALTVTLQSESVGNFEADTDQWTVPINLLISKVATFGTFPASYQVGFGGYVAHPEGGPTWKIRSAIVLLLPRQK